MRRIEKNSQIRVYIASAISLAAWVVTRVAVQNVSSAGSEQLEAARLMEGALHVIRSHCESTGVPVDPLLDPNRTGLIGPERTELTTTLGHLEAKRTTTQPDFAALIVHLLDQAGVCPGDTVAAGCSASFPGLLIALLCACRSMEVHPVVILSLGASSYGATRPDFHLLDLYRLLLTSEMIGTPPGAVSLGGERDIGETFPERLRLSLILDMHRSGFRVIGSPDLRENVRQRMGIYFHSPAAGRIAAFVNIGGSYANMGTSTLVLSLEPGINRRLRMPDEEEGGVIHAMARLGIPVIHLLYIKGLSTAYGLPWDPIPLPPAGSHLPEFRKQPRTGFTRILAAYAGLLLLVSLFPLGMRKGLD